MARPRAAHPPAPPPFPSPPLFPPLPRPVTGVFVRQVIQSACPGHFAVVWSDAEPLSESVVAREAVEFVDDLPAACHEVQERTEAPLPAEFVTAFERGFRQGWRLRGYGLPLYGVRIILRDAVWHELASNPWGFQAAGRHTAGEVLDCVREDRAPRRVGHRARPDRPIPPMPRLRAR